MKFRLGAGLQADIEFFAVCDDFLHDRTHLIYFYRVNHEILALIIIRGSSLLEAVADFLDTVVENVRKTQKNRRRNIAYLKFVKHLFYVHRGTAFTRRHCHMPFFIDGEIVASPSCDIVQFCAVLNTPFSHRLIIFCG